MKELLRVAVICLGLLMAGPVSAVKPFRLDPARPMTQYVIASWRDTSGLPADSIAAMAQTPDGYIWLATEHGLVRFDGVRFTTFTRENTPALKTSDIFTIFVDREGTLWVGTRGGGAVTYDGSTFRRVPIRLLFISGFAQSQDGAVWIAAPGGVSRLLGQDVTTIFRRDGYPGGRVSAVAADRNGVYVALPTGIVRMDGRSVRVWNEQHGLSSEVQSLLWTSRGLFAGTVAGGVDRLSEDRFEAVLPGGSGHAITSMIEGADGSLWMSSVGGGLLRQFGGRLDALTSRDGLSTDSLNQLLEDHEGNLWAATIGGGLLRLTQGSITSILPPESLEAEWILALASGRDGSTWFTTRGGGLYRLQDASLTRYTRADGLLRGLILSIAEDREGSVWIGFDRGLQRLADGRFHTVPVEEGGGEPVHALTVARDGSVWAGTESGLLHIANGRIRRLTGKDGLTKGPYVSIREAADGTLWLAKPMAVEHYANGRTMSWSSEDGLRARMITSLEIDEKDGSVWVATMGDGVARIRDGRVRTYRVANGLPTDSVYGIVLDRSGHFWMSTGIGLFTIRRNDLDAFDDGRTGKLRTRMFRKPDGLKSNDLSGGFDRPAFRAADGTLWFASTRGLAVVDPDAITTATTAPRVIIESVTAHGARYDAAPIDVAPAHRQIEIAYTSPTYHSPEATTFQYRLEGFEKEWHDAGTRRTAYYTNVPPGSFRFVVRAQTREGVFAETSKVIEITPRFYETWLFKIAVALAILLLAIVLHRRRTDALRRHQDALRASEEHFRSLIENGSDMILVVDLDGFIRYASPSVTRGLGFPPEKMHNRAFTTFLVTPSAGETLLADIESQGRHEATISFLDASRGERDIECVGASDMSGRVVLSCRDVTDRRRLELQLEQANRLSSLGRLAATVSHEFNNVLMGVQPFVDIIRRKSPDDAVQHATQQMSRSIERGKRISEQILRYTRPVEPNLAPLPVRSWLSDLEIEIRALAGDNVRVAVIAPADLAILGDAAQLNQVLTNLAINARDADATQIVLEALEPGDSGVFPFGIVRHVEQYVHIIVRDNGRGIPDSVRPKIFEPLFTTKTTKGTGLGLAVAQQVIARHGGEIFVESAVGSGSAFHIFLPRSEDLPHQERTVESSAVHRAGCRLLLVEDDTVIAEGMLALLEAEGFEVHLAVSGGDALHLLPRVKPDVVVLDVGLPDLGGIEVYQRIVQQWPEVPVIFSTGHADLGLLQESLEPPHPPALLKPYEISTLLETIASVVPASRVA